MKFRSLGKIPCSVLGLGTGKLASLGTGLSDTERRRVFDTAADSGITLIDTADSYAQGDCERLLGKMMHGKRERFLVTTKAGFRFASLGGLARLLKPFARHLIRRLRSGRALVAGVRQQAMQMNVRSQDFSALEAALAASLRRLHTDYVDLFLLHNPPSEVLADVRVHEALAAVVRAGKARLVGVSSPDPDVLAASLNMPLLHVVQTPIHPGVSNDVIGMLAQFAARGVAVVGNQISFSGKLLAPPVDEPDAWAAGRMTLKKQADEYGWSVSRLLLQFALAQPSVTSILTGTTNAEHLRQNVADVLAGPELNGEQITAIRTAFLNIK